MKEFWAVVGGGCKSELPSAYHAAIPKSGPLASYIAKPTEN